MYSKNALTLADAKAIAAAAEAEALRNNWRVTIAVLDDGGHLIYLQRLDEAPLGSITVAQEKARTALLFKRPTKIIEEIVASGRMATPGGVEAAPSWSRSRPGDPRSRGDAR